MGSHINDIYDYSLQEDVSACQEQLLGLRVFSLTLKGAPEPYTTILCFSPVRKYPTLLLFQSFLKVISRGTPSYTELIFPTSLSLHFQPSIQPEIPRSRSSSLTAWNSNLIAWTLMSQRHENHFFFVSYLSDCLLPDRQLTYSAPLVLPVHMSSFRSKTEVTPPPSCLISLGMLSLTLY